MLLLQGQEKQITDQEQDSNTTKGKEIFYKDTSQKVDILCKTFEQLAPLISKDKPKMNIQDITCQKCKKPGHYGNHGQLIRSTT